jgi:Bacterial PH domain
MALYDLTKEIGIVRIKPDPIMGAVLRSGWSIIFIFPFIWHYVRLVKTTYYLTSHRLRISTGVFKEDVDETELFRVRDMGLRKPFFLLFTSLNNIILHSEDPSTPIANLEAIPNYYWVFETMRKLVYERRQEVPPFWK